MKKKQRYSSGGSPIKKYTDVFSLDGSNKRGITTKVTTPPYKGVSASSTQHDGKYAGSTLKLKLPKKGMEVNISSAKDGHTSGRVSKSFGKGNKSSVEAIFNRPKGGGSGTYYGIKVTRKLGGK
jgi:hypothetical protein|tara:strand:- start:9035 stop:9406 length:372 start_codon:yes stop_codon:yes gene_type:complete